MKIYYENKKYYLCCRLAVRSGRHGAAIEKDTLALKFGNVVSGETINRSVRTNPANALFGQLTGLYMMQTAAETNVLDDQLLSVSGVSVLSEPPLR